MIDSADYPDAELLELVGVVGYREFESASDYTKEKLRENLRRLVTLSDGEFIIRTEHAIYESARISRFRGNWDHIHCYTTACYHQSELRKVLAGHDAECHVETLYKTAFRNVTGRYGMFANEIGECSCDFESFKKD